MNFITELIEGLKISWAAICGNKLRSGLTTLGIVIGIVTVTLMGTAIEGLRSAFTKGIAAMGADIFYVERYSWLSDEDWWAVRNRREITPVLAKEVEKQMTLARAVAPVAMTMQAVKYGVRSAGRVRTLGTTDQFILTGNLSMGEGRYLLPAEVDGGRPVCVIGWEVADKLFPRESSLGQHITIGADPYEVVGVIEKRGSFLGMFSFDQEVQIPITRFRRNIDSFAEVRIDVKVADLQEMAEAKEELRGLLRKLRRLAPGAQDDFAINQQDMFVQAFKRVGGTIASAGLFLTGLSLFVGGIGIMNIMFVSVAERTREIGIRKAIGAKRRTILLQFLIEAATICFLGGVLALLVTLPVTLALKRILPAALSVTVVSVALLISILTGLLSGLMPAVRAARMDPVEALRQE